MGTVSWSGCRRVHSLLSRVFTIFMFTFSLAQHILLRDETAYRGGMNELKSCYESCCCYSCIAICGFFLYSFLSKSLYRAHYVVIWSNGERKSVYSRIACIFTTKAYEYYEDRSTRPSEKKILGGNLIPTTFLDFLFLKTKLLWYVFVCEFGCLNV